MSSFNKVILMGNFTRDPELRQMQSGTSVMSASIAVNESRLDRDGTRRDVATFVELSAFGRTAENIQRYFFKGSPILIEGRLTQQSWTDKQSGQSRSKVVVVLDRFEFVGSKDSGNATNAAPAQSSQAKLSTSSQEWSDNDDVPF